MKIFGDKKLLKEAVERGEYNAVAAALKTQKYFMAWRKEAILNGNISDETTDVEATLEFISEVTICIDKYHTLDFYKKFKTDKATMKIPKGTRGTASAISGGAFTDSPMTTDDVDVALDKEYGIQVSWTRAHVEDAPWNAFAVQNREAGEALAIYLAKLGLDLIKAMPDANFASGAIIDLSSPITWAEFCSVLSAVDVATGKPADIVLCSPAIYWQLLALEQLTSALYNGGEDVMTSGVLHTTFGVTIVKMSDIESDALYALNSKQAIALCVRAEPAVEPYEHPETNIYGFILRTRCKVAILCNKSIQSAETTVDTP